MPRKRKPKQDPTEPTEVRVAIAEPLDRLMESRPPVAEERPPEREIIQRPLGPRGKWAEGWSSVEEIGPGKIRFRVKPAQNQCQMKFDDECQPTPELRGWLKQVGWDYFPDSKVEGDPPKIWTYQRGKDQYAATVEAERHFDQCVQHMRDFFGEGRSL